jgi:hypothetical protein
MKLDEIKKKASELGIETKGQKKAGLILKVQKAEGNTPCFGQNDGNCPFADCCFWKDCITEHKKKK